MPTPSLVDISIIYGISWTAFIIILLVAFVLRIVLYPNKRRNYFSTFMLLIISLITAIIYFFIWDYSTNSILIKIVNNTGKDVEDAGIYGCLEQNWGRLKNGDSKTVRLPRDSGCSFIVTYRLNEFVKHEMLPSKDFIVNVYKLGNNPDIDIN